MPARTLSPFVATDRALLSPPAHRPSTRSPSRPRRDAHAHGGALISLGGDLYYHNPLYDTSASLRLVGHHSPFAQEYGPWYPLFAPPTERTSNVSNAVFPPAPLHVQPSSPPPPGWLPHPPSLARLPPLTPPPLMHKVWILDCKACGTFLTNRGMKAVLLLRPNVPLYSTDALPINCSAQHTMLDESSPVKPEPSELASPTAPPLTTASNEPGRVQPSRTCECLTQTLYCHGCGKGVGYMIVIPCHRCTSSMTVTNRMTNGHRFVFYSCEIAPSERHYVPSEPGVMEHDVPPVPSPPSHSIPHMHMQMPYPLHTQAQNHPAVPAPTTPRRATRSPLRGRRGAHMRTSSSSSPRSRRSTVSSDPGSPPPLVPISPHRLHSPGAHDASGRDAARPHYARIAPGDVLYWHNLVRSGEIPAVKEDARARRASAAAAGHFASDGCADRKCDIAAEMPPPPPKRKIFAGR